MSRGSGGQLEVCPPLGDLELQPLTGRHVMWVKCGSVLADQAFGCPWLTARLGLQG